MVNRSAWEGKKRREGKRCVPPANKTSSLLSNRKRTWSGDGSFLLTFCGEQLTTAADYSYDSDAMLL